MQLQFLLKDYLELNLACDIQAVALDSRCVTPGALFIAKQGVSQHGEAFVADALAQGAVAVLKDRRPEEPMLTWNADVPIVALTHLERYVGEIVARFYGYPSRALKLFGVTGTNGKTTTTHFIAQGLEAVGNTCGLIGTLGTGRIQALSPSALTTPSVTDLQHLFATFQADALDATAMEVSSHALSQGRCDSVEFDVAILTNLTRDHLDYHGSMQAYRQAKKRLFTQAALQCAVLPAADSFSQEIVDDLPGVVRVVWYGVSEGRDTTGEPGYWAHDVVQQEAGMQFNLDTPEGRCSIELSVPGLFNVENALAALAALHVQGVSLEYLPKAACSFQTPKGRLQCLKEEGTPTVFVDFAHTPDALSRVLQTLKALNPNRLVCVFGCGGGRDAGKRPEMGAVASQYADEVIITEDNPRDESSKSITDAIVSGVPKNTRYQVILNRGEAITQALAKASPEDIVLIAGKGHEAFQEIKGDKQPFSDIEYVQGLLKR